MTFDFKVGRGVQNDPETHWKAFNYKRTTFLKY